MDLRDRRSLKTAAAEALSACSGSPAKLVLLHAGALALFSIGTSLLDEWLKSLGENASGLSGMSTISTLETIRQLLNILATFAPLCWTMGYTHAALRMGRGEGADPRDLLKGFRRFGPVVRYTLLEGVVTVIVSVAVCSVGGTLLCMTPLAAPAYKVLAPLMEDPEALNAVMLDEATMDALTEALMPVVIGCMVLCLLALIPILYRMRFARYLLMDEPGAGAFAAMVGSFSLTKGNCRQLLKLDLSFWWYYLATLVIAALAYGDILLGLVGITLPFSSEAAFYVFYAVSLLGQLVLYSTFLNQVECTYVQAYDTILNTPVAPAPSVPISTNVPWDAPPTKN